MGISRNTQRPTAEPPASRDLNLATCQITAGSPVSLEDRGGVIYFVFQGDPTKLKEIEDGYWDGTLQLPARELLTNLRTLKSRLYELKDARHRPTYRSVFKGGNKNE